MCKPGLLITDAWQYCCYWRCYYSSAARHVIAGERSGVYELLL